MGVIPWGGYFLTGIIYDCCDYVIGVCGTGIAVIVGLLYVGRVIACIIDGVFGRGLDKIAVIM